MAHASLCPCLVNKTVRHHYNARKGLLRLWVDENFCVTFSVYLLRYLDGAKVVHFPNTHQMFFAEFFKKFLFG